MQICLTHNAKLSKGEEWSCNDQLQLQPEDIPVSPRLVNVAALHLVKRLDVQGLQILDSGTELCVCMYM